MASTNPSPLLPTLPEPAPTVECGVSDEWRDFIEQQVGYIAARRAPDALVQAVQAWDGPDRRRRTDRIRSCGAAWTQVDRGGRWAWAPVRCTSRWCPYCGSVWQRDVMRRLSPHTPAGAVPVLFTFTVGPRCNRWELRQRVVDIRRIFRRWRRRATRSLGILGGVYSLEIVPPRPDAPGFHVHLHATVLLPSDCWLFGVDDDYLAARHSVAGDTTPALVWAVRSWSLAAKTECPALWASWPRTVDLLPSLAAPWPCIRFPYVEHAAVVDVGNRWPRPDCAGVLESLRGGDLNQVLQQTLKYVVKPVDSEQVSVDPGDWLAIVGAMQGVRRAQPFGCWYNLPVNDDNEDAVVRSNHVYVVGVDRARALRLVQSYWWQRSAVCLSVDRYGCELLLYGSNKQPDYG